MMQVFAEDGFFFVPSIGTCTIAVSNQAVQSFALMNTFDLIWYVTTLNGTRKLLRVLRFH